MRWWPGRRRTSTPPPFEPAWRELLASRWAAWAELDEAERPRLEDLIARFLGDKHWEAARGFELTDELRVLIAAQACLLVLGLDLDRFDHVHTIIVHRSTQIQRGERAVGTSRVRTDSPRRIAGRTGLRRPVVLAADAARREARAPGRGRSVVLHEFAHQLDVADGALDGTPPLPEEDRARWIEVCAAHYEAVLAGSGEPLRAYAGENPAEFFAVATEAFFARPIELADQRPDLYDVLRRFYRQDPATRRRRAADA